MRVLAVSSAGGHYSEMRMILDNLTEEIDVVTVTEKKGQEDRRVDYYIPYSNRADKVKYLFAFIRNFFLAFKILRKTKPDKIISTGAHTAFFFFVVGKLCFKTTNIYVESFAKVSGKSLTYKLSHRFIDVNVVQHQEMIESEPGSLYFGGVY